MQYVTNMYIGIGVNKKSRQQEFIKGTAAQADNTKKGAEQDLFAVFVQYKLSWYLCKIVLMQYVTLRFDK